MRQAINPLEPRFSIERTILPAEFVDRPNRFVVRCRLKGRLVRAFMPNPGRMHELLFPGSRLYITASPAVSGGSARRTQYTAMAVERDGKPIFLQTHLANQVVRSLILRGDVPSLASAHVVSSEVTSGHSRFDFLLADAGRQSYLEVKSCTLFGNRVAMFPDAITERGRKHLLELGAIQSEPVATVLFLVHTPDVDWFMPDFHTDLAFSQTLLAMRHHVRIIALSIGWRSDLSLEPGVRELPIPWSYLEREVEDRGAYLLILRLRRRRSVTVGKLGRFRFESGFYVYIGSAMANLSARVARHVRKRKQLHWHVDYLRQVADEVVPLPVRASRRLECLIATEFGALLDLGPTGFGSADCNCRTHLLFSRANPLENRDFHQQLQQFRMAHPD